MSHRVEYIQTLTICEDNRLYAMLSAKWENEFLDVYKVDFETGKAYARDGNLVYKSLGGYLVDFPNEKRKPSWYYGYYGGETVKLYEYTELRERIKAIEWGHCMQQTPQRLRETILKFFPDLKYLIKKLNDGEIQSVFKLIDKVQMYRKHPETENLYAMGFEKIANNNNLYRLGKEKKKEIISFLKQLDLAKAHDYKLNVIQKAIKLELNKDVKFWQDVYNFYNGYWGWECPEKMELIFSDYSLKVYRYCTNKEISYTYYNDIINMANQLGHRTDDPYYAYPNNPVRMHNKLQKQIDAQKAAKEKNKLAILPKIAKKNLKEPLVLDGGYQLFIPTTYEQFLACKELLHQCLLSADYIGKMAKGNSLIVMIWKDGKPSSTAEIDYKGKLLQFYGDEHDRNNCKPKDEEYKILNNFMATFKPKRITKYLAA